MSEAACGHFLGSCPLLPPPLPGHLWNCVHCPPDEMLTFMHFSLLLLPLHRPPPSTAVRLVPLFPVPPTATVSFRAHMGPAILPPGALGVGSAGKVQAPAVVGRTQTCLPGGQTAFAGCKVGAMRNGMQVTRHFQAQAAKSCVPTTPHSLQGTPGLWSRGWSYGREEVPSPHWTPPMRGSLRGAESMTLGLSATTQPVLALSDRCI